MRNFILKAKIRVQETLYITEVTILSCTRQLSFIAILLEVYFYVHY